MIRPNHRVAYRYLRTAMTFSDALRVMDLPANSVPTPEEVQKVYRSKAKQFHPDLGGDPQKMVELNVAKDILTGEGTGASGGSSESTGYAPPQKEPEPSVISFDAAKPSLPDVEWILITDSAWSGYSSGEFERSHTGRVLIGSHGDKWVALAIQHDYYKSYVGYFSVGNNVKPLDEWHMQTVSMPKGSKPVHQELYGLTLKAWTHLSVEKKWNSKVKPLPQGWRLTEEALRKVSSIHSTTIKNFALDTGASAPAEGAAPRKYTIDLIYNEEYSADSDSRARLKILVNGKEFPLSIESSIKMQRKRIVEVVFGTYAYPDTKKSLNRLAKGKQVMEWLLKNIPDLDPSVTAALESTIAATK